MVQVAAYFQTHGTRVSPFLGDSTEQGNSYPSSVMMNPFIHSVLPVPLQRSAFHCQRLLLAGVAKVLLALVLSVSVAAHAQTTTGTTANGLVWSATNSEVTITGYIGTPSALSISGTISVSGSNLPVTSIGNSAFSGCSNLTSVTIPASVTSISDTAFQNCFLTSITVDSSNSVYSSLSGVLFNKEQTILLQYPLKKADSSYTIPSTVINIASYAFYNSLNLTNITIPNSVTSIGFATFYGCECLTSLTIPSSVSSIS